MDTLKEKREECCWEHRPFSHRIDISTEPMLVEDDGSDTGSDLKDFIVSDTEMDTDTKDDGDDVIYCDAFPESAKPTTLETVARKRRIIREDDEVEISSKRRVILVEDDD
jgi:hypothetical protein